MEMYVIEHPDGEQLRYTRSWFPPTTWSRFADFERQGDTNNRVALIRNIAEDAGYHCVEYRPLPNEYKEMA